MNRLVTTRWEIENVNKIATYLAFGAIMLMCASAAHSDDMVAFATGGYASGLRTKAMMHKMDANHDNMVSRKEWIVFQNKVFAMLDKKKTGKVDESEYMAASPEVASFATGGYASGLLTPEMFKKIDTNSDGTISRHEFLSYQLKIFDMMDTSSTHKGMLAPGEFFATGGAPAP
ncbi:MAG: EF-hand domain-containing protein [Steroidobacteraceae bacterium]